MLSYHLTYQINVDYLDIFECAAKFKVNFYAIFFFPDKK